eukprot:TRINITY_DN9068_c0_g1_i1.p1 TRINITY_DN9068_c0_g1~~TRINITY_DN9068_c0_g1_i1.p1  ORF type:complete len:542 (-),score=102.42 TRINITY_DN9068_c0_g1_i1:36-1661(-)
MDFDVAQANKKAAALNETNREFKQLFNLPDGEKVIQDYSASVRGGIGGHLYISANYVCYASNLTSYMEKIPFRRVTDITEEKATYTYITLHLEERKVQFCSFIGWGDQYNEALNLMRYLWRNPPSYIDLSYSSVPLQPPSTKHEPEASNRLSSKPISSTPVRLSTSIGRSTSPQTAGSQSKEKDSDMGDWGGSEVPRNTNPFSQSFTGGNRVAVSPTKNTNSFGFQQQATVEVNVAASKEALGYALEAERTASDTLTILAEQGEQIDRIEAGLDRIHFKLDRGERLLRDIESLPAYLGNSLWEKSNKRKILTPAQRNLAVKKGKSPPMDIEILCKMPDDSLVPAILSLEEDCFLCINPHTNELLQPGFKCYFVEMAGVLIRVRPSHADIRFVQKPGAPPRERFRFMSSYLQVIVNELYLRSKEGNHQIQVCFEPGATTFQYADPRISATSTRATRNENATFVRKGQLTVAGLISNASPQAKSALEEVDKDLDQISSILGRPKIQDAMQIRMGYEMFRELPLFKKKLFEKKKKKKKKKSTLR